MFYCKSFAFNNWSAKSVKLFHLKRFAIYGICDLSDHQYAFFYISEEQWLIIATAKFSIIMVLSLEMDAIWCHSRCSFLLLALQSRKITYNMILGFAKFVKIFYTSLAQTLVAKAFTVRVVMTWKYAHYGLYHTTRPHRNV